MLVLDTSAALEALLVGTEQAESLRRRLAEVGELLAPHLIDTEMLHALRRLVRLGTIGEDRASDVRRDFARLSLIRCPHEPLSDRIWQLRANLTAYDATFVALAEALEAPLVTCDGRLAATPGHDAQIELFGTN